jgi:hypothetical protein
MEQAQPYFPLRLYTSIWFLLTAALAGLGAWELYLNHAFAARGIGDEAFVEREYNQVWHDKYGDPRYEPHIVYRYDVNGVTYHPDTVITDDTEVYLRTRVTIPIKYLPEAPARSRIDLEAESDHYRLKAGGGIYIGFLIFVIGGFILGYSASQNAEWKRLKRLGFACIGRVQSIETTNPRTRNERRFLIVEFTDQAGHRIQGRAQTLSLLQRTRWKEGDSIRVYYDPQNTANFGFDLALRIKPGLRVS